VARTKISEERLFALLQKHNQTEKTVQNLDTTMIKLLSLQEMASVQEAKTSRTVDSLVLQVTHTKTTIATLVQELSQQGLLGVFEPLPSSRTQNPKNLPNQPVSPCNTATLQENQVRFSASVSPRMSSLLAKAIKPPVNPWQIPRS
jgi:tRNA A58 N-methylase Trm61